MQSVTSNAVAVATDIKLVTIPEGGSSVTPTKWGLFFWGSPQTRTYDIKVINAGTTVSPTNAYWGEDPAPGYAKYMWGIYI
jgi:hypothetical protein